MSNQSLAEQVKSDIQSLQSSSRDLQTSVRLTDIRDGLEDLGTSVNGMDRRIESLRERGYAFEKELEETAADFEKEWAGIVPNLEAQIEKEASVMERSLRPLEAQIAGLAGESGAPAALQPRLSKLKAQVESLEGRVEAAERSIRGGYDQFSNCKHAVKAIIKSLQPTGICFDISKQGAVLAGFRYVRGFYPKTRDSTTNF